MFTIWVLFVLLAIFLIDLYNIKLKRGSQSITQTQRKTKISFTKYIWRKKSRQTFYIFTIFLSCTSLKTTYMLYDLQYLLWFCMDSFSMHKTGIITSWYYNWHFRYSHFSSLSCWICSQQLNWWIVVSIADWNDAQNIKKVRVTPMNPYISKCIATSPRIM